MAQTMDFFRARLDAMRGWPRAIDLRHPLAVIKPAEFERIIIDSTVQEKAMALGHPVAYPVDSRLLEIARYKIVVHAKRCGIALRQSFTKPNFDPLK